jgi:hypothetical protein
MDWADKNDWRNVTGLAIPPGKKVQVWVQQKPVHNGANYQSERALFWQFPVGTQAFDVLIRKRSDGEHIFTVRKRERGADGWDDGVSFMPDIAKQEIYYEDWGGTDKSRDVLGLPSIRFRYAKVAPIKNYRAKFVEMKNSLGMTDGGHFFPKGFSGTGMSCSKCHNVVSLKNDLAQGGEKSPYAGPTVAGKDTIYSWYPVTVQSVDSGRNVPDLDYRWPIEFIGHY